MPHLALIGKVGVVQESLAWLTVPNHPACIIAERIILEFLVTPYVGAAVDCRVLPGVVDYHGGVELVPEPLFEIFEGLCKLG